jgi:histidine triad (HIT) family protein
MHECIFCQIASGAVPSYTIWESKDYMGFLTLFPNTPGASVVIPKQHHSSDIHRAPQAVRAGLVEAAATVAHKLERAFPDVGRVGMIFEGFGVDHLHAKLYPMHGTGAMKQWGAIESPDTTWFSHYLGYLDSRDGAKASDSKLAKVLELIKAAQGRPE